MLRHRLTPAHIAGAGILMIQTPTVFIIPQMLSLKILLDPWAFVGTGMPPPSDVTNSQ